MDITIEINHTDKWDPPLNCIHGLPGIISYRTKRDAEKGAKEFGWQQYKVLRINFRFESLWFVGAVDFQDENVGGIIFKVLRLPLKSFKRVNGKSTRDVLTTRLLKEIYDR